MLEVRDLAVGYGGLQVLWGVSLRVEEGEFVGLLGPNGAGKTTLLHTIVGLMKPWGGDVILGDESLKGQPANRVVQHGIGLISETCNLFPAMSVRDNLLLGAWAIKDKARQQQRLEYAYDLFPRLQERASQWAGTLSGGERKMLAIGRALMAEPKLLLVDEPSLGLAPNTSQLVFGVLQTLHAAGHSILLVEQNVRHTLRIVQRAYVLEQGRIAFAADATDLSDHSHIQKIYMGAR